MSESQDPAPRVSLVILNWNGWEETLACLESVLGIEYSNYEVVVVDNASTDGSVGQIEQWARAKGLSLTKLRCNEVGQPAPPPQRANERVLTILESTTNRGYGGGNNLGIAWALRRKADFVALLNNDTVVEPGFLGPLVEAALSDSRVAIVGSIVRTPRGEIHFAGGKIFLLRAISRFNLDRKKHHWESDLVAGCSMLVSRSFLEHESRWLDERLFLYGEELEICTRARQKGFKVLMARDSQVYHKGSATTWKVSAPPGKGVNPLNAYYSYRNKLLICRELLSPGARVVFAVIFHAVLGARIGQALLTRNYKLARAIVQAVKDGWAGVGGKWSAQE